MNISKKSFKKAVSLLLSISLIAGLFVFLASGQEYTDSTGYTYTLSGSGATLTGYEGELSGSVMLPESLGNETVTAIGEGAFKGFDDVLCFFMPETVTSIGDYAFEGCTALVDTRIPDSVTYVGEGAYWGCSSLVSVTVPESVTKLGPQVLYGASSLESLVLLGRNTKISSLFDIDIDLGNFVSIGSSVELINDVDATVYLYEYGDASSSSCTQAFEYITRNAIYDYVLLEECELTSYTVSYVNAGGASLYPSKTYAAQPVGITVNAAAAAVENYEADTAVKTAALAGGTNSIVFTYSNDFSISFDTDGGNDIAPVYYIPGNTITSLPTPVKENYTFNGWLLDGKEFTLPYTMQANHITLTASWTLNSYTVEFKDWDGRVIDTQTVSHGSDASAPADPTREGYTFTGWDKAFTAVSSDLTVNALYDINVYTVTFKNWNDLVIDTQSVPYGSAATAPEAPTRTGYTFKGWDTSFDNVKSDLTVTALFDANYYTVTFKDWDGTVIDTQSIKHGLPATAPEAPSRTGYTFSRWDTSFSVVLADTTVTALYNINYYTVTFKDWNGNVLDTQSVPYGSAATAPADPTRTGYTFTGWNSSFDFIEDTTEVIAQYDIKYLTVEFVDWDGTVLKSEQVAYGSYATAPENPTRPGHTFDKWSGKYDYITSDTTVSAEYKINSYIVTFVNWDDSVIDTQSVAYGSAAKAPAVPTRTGYTFTEWDKDFSNITEGITVKALFTINSYTVTFVDWDNREIDTQTVTHGSAATAPDAPTREGYDFNGWNRAFDNITSDTTVKATYVAKYFSVSFIDWDGTTLSSQIIKYGESADAPESPAREGYDFIGWDADFSRVVSALTVNAQYTIKTFTVTFVDWDGTVIKKAQTVDYGSAATAPADPTREGYNFIGWDKEFDSVKENLEVKAIYELIPEEITLIAAEGSTTVIDSENGLIYGLDLALTADKLSDYLTVTGDGYIEYEGYVTYIGTGTKVYLKDSATNEVIAEYTVVIFGDLNGDGVITSADQSVIRKAATGSTLEGAFLKAADLDSDGLVNSTDYAVIKAYLKGNVTIGQTGSYGA